MGEVIADSVQTIFYVLSRISAKKKNVHLERTKTRCERKIIYTIKMFSETTGRQEATKSGWHFNNVRRKVSHELTSHSLFV